MKNFRIVARIVGSLVIALANNAFAEAPKNSVADAVTKCHKGARIIFLFSFSKIFVKLCVP